MEHLDRDAERVLLCDPETEEDGHLLRPRGLRLGTQSAERYHVIGQNARQQKPSQRMCFH